MLSSLSSMEGSHYTGDKGAMGGVGRATLGGRGGGALNFDSSTSPATLPSTEKLRHESDQFGHFGGIGDQFQSPDFDDDIFGNNRQPGLGFGRGRNLFGRGGAPVRQKNAPDAGDELQNLAEQQALATAQLGSEGLSVDQGSASSIRGHRPAYSTGSPPSPPSTVDSHERSRIAALFGPGDSNITQFRPSEGPVEGEFAEDVRRAANLEYNINKFSKPMRKLQTEETLGPFGGKYTSAGDGYGRDDMAVIDRKKDLVWQDYPGFTDQNFVSITKLGSGGFGDVRLVRGKTDGLYYALKEGKWPMNIMPGVLQKKQLNEIHALSILKESYYIIKYYNSWCDHMNIYIQLEFCNAGTMTSLIMSKMRRKEPVAEGELKTQLLHVGLGLQYMHASGIAHMDIKPDNIFIHVKGELPSVNYFYEQMATAETEGPYTAEQCLNRGGLPVYKIGDLGLATEASKRVRDLAHDELGDPKSARVQDRRPGTGYRSFQESARSGP
ncbi:wee1-like protein kinase 2-A [Convolutriloba macropyga]|uniref:wee1-like protein kinase 2-A n=1 Tax=Convolutriloba macropyga TaxID=536237 RepID=UPI003F522946